VNRVIVIAILAACGPHQPPPQPPIANTSEQVAETPAAGQVSGTLFDDDGNPLDGATVVLASSGMSTIDTKDDHIAISHADGRYAVPAVVDPGTYTLTIYYADRTVQRDIAVNGATTVDQHIPLLRSGNGGEILRCLDETLASCK
jgi:hypothetical protein